MVHIKCPAYLLLEGTGLGVTVTSSSFNSMVALLSPTHPQCWCEEVQSHTATYGCVGESRVISIVSKLCYKSSKAMKLPGLALSNT